MASTWQHPYLAQGALADYQRGYVNTLASAYGPGSTTDPCRPQHPKCPSTQYCPESAFADVPCGYNGVVANCPKNSMLDWWVTGWQNSIYAVNGGSLWPYLEDTYPACNCYEYAPKLLGCCAIQPATCPSNALPGLASADDGPGTPIRVGYGFNAEAAASANLGVGNYSRMQKKSPPRALQEPCAGTWIR